VDATKCLLLDGDAIPKWQTLTIFLLWLTFRSSVPVRIVRLPLLDGRGAVPTRALLLPWLFSNATGPSALPGAAHRCSGRPGICRGNCLCIYVWRPATWWVCTIGVFLLAAGFCTWTRPRCAQSVCTCSGSPPWRWWRRNSARFLMRRISSPRISEAVVPRTSLVRERFSLPRTADPSAAGRCRGRGESAVVGQRNDGRAPVELFLPMKTKKN